MPVTKHTIDWNDKKSFGEVYLLYFKKLYRLCYLHLQDTEESKEIVHDLFRSLLERKEPLVIEVSLENYLVKATKLKIFQYLRNKHNHEKIMASALLTTPVADNPTEEAVSFQALADRLDVLTAQLPPRCERVFTLSRRQGMSHSEIATLLGISEKAVEHQITRALNFLRKELVEYR